MKTKLQQLRHPQFLILHAAALIGSIFLPIYLKAVSWLSGIFGGCIMKRFFIYCPMCGGTRAVAALVRFDFVAAWNYNALVVLLGIAALALDVWAWVRYAQKKEPLIVLPNWSWGALAVALVVFFVLRNALMIFWGIDPTGDLVYFWDAIRALKN